MQVGRVSSTFRIALAAQQETMILRSHLSPPATSDFGSTSNPRSPTADMFVYVSLDNERNYAKPRVPAKVHIFSSYLTGNTLHLQYKDYPVCGNNRVLFRESYKTLRGQNTEFLEHQSM